MQRTLVAALARRFLPWIVVFVASLVAAPAPAWADPATESAAKALEKKAVEEDFLNMDYPAAIKKLQAASAKCDGDKCSAGVKGAILRDTGAMQILAGNEGDGRQSFAQALALDPSLELDPAYKNPQLEGIWADVKKKAPPAAGGGGGAAPPAVGPQPSGDFTHTPPAEELVSTPLPVYAEYAGGETLARVIVKYKGAQMGDWKPIELQKMGETGWGGLIPCKDVTQGVMEYYLQGFNAANDPVATSGSRSKPYTVPVKAKIAGQPPSLPGQEPPKQCSMMATAECPPDFPGCNSKKAAGEECDKDDQCQSNSCVAGRCAEKKSGGESCSTDDECASGSCSDGTCTEAKKAEGADCDTDDECQSGSCKEGKCTAGGKHRRPRIFIGLVLPSVDGYLLPGAQDVCKLNGSGSAPYTSGNPYSCYDGGGNQFPPVNAPNGAAINNAIQLGHSDQVEGGFAHGPIYAAAITLDYALNPNMLIGLRGGYELGTIPAGGAFAPLHLEARFTYLIGKDALYAKLAPIIFAGGGVGEFDAYVPVQVFGNAQFPSNPVQENAWITAGPAFVTAGGGVRLTWSKSRWAVIFAARLLAAFGGTAGFLPGIAPEIGFQYGF